MLNCSTQALEHVKQRHQRRAHVSHRPKLEGCHCAVRQSTPNITVAGPDFTVAPLHSCTAAELQSCDAAQLHGCTHLGFGLGDVGVFLLHYLVIAACVNLFFNVDKVFRDALGYVGAILVLVPNGRGVGQGKAATAAEGQKAGCWYEMSPRPRPRT